MSCVFEDSETAWESDVATLRGVADLPGETRGTNLSSLFLFLAGGVAAAK